MIEMMRGLGPGSLKARCSKSWGSRDGGVVGWVGGLDGNHLFWKHLK